MIPTAPTFRKVDLLLKVESRNYNEDDSLKDFDITPTVKVTHDDCAMIITGDYVIITQDEGDNEVDAQSSVKGKIYNLKEIDSYRLYKE
jgi:hypothetical protein